MLRCVSQRVAAWYPHAQFSRYLSVSIDNQVSHASIHSPRGNNARPRSPRHVNRPPRLRIEDKRMNVLLSNKTTSDSFVSMCRTMRSKDATALVATTDPQAWNVALQRRLKVKDERGAAELLGLVASFARENANESVWTDLLFTVLRQRSSRIFRTEEIQDILAQLKRRYGPRFVARVLVGVVNGCANIKMLDAAQELLLYQQNLWSEIRETDPSLDVQEPLMPPSIVGHLMTKMMQTKRYNQVLELAIKYIAHPEFIAARDFQQQGFFALLNACVKTQQNPRKIVSTFLDYVYESVQYSQGDLKTINSLVLERGFGAAIQCCVTMQEFPLALHCFTTMENVRTKLVGPTDHLNIDHTSDEAERIVDEVLPVDENICVNVMKACMALNNFIMFKDVYRGMAARGVARSAGFGLAIRYCHKLLDSTFLEEVLDGVFATEQELAGSWMLEVENYNDALGCFAATNRPEQARELFLHMLNNPFIDLDHITMLEMVENHRKASIEEIFDLLDVFLNRKLVPNLQVFTSLLSICMRRRILGDAIALINAMKKHGVIPDVKVYTTIAFIHASHGDLQALVDVLKDMTNQDVATDQIFFDYVVNAIYGSCGIDMCFSFLRELNLHGLSIPEGLYVSLVGLGTKIGLIERTLHVAYNMECEGFRLSCQQLHDLMMRCHSNSEISEFLRTFSLLHQGLQPPIPRFEIELYEDLISVLTRLNRKDEIAKVYEMAKTAGHQELIA